MADEQLHPLTKNFLENVIEPDYRDLALGVDSDRTNARHHLDKLVEEFFTAFCNHAGANVHVNLAYGDNLHHIVEAVFKAFARALDEATQLDPRVEGVLSSKGTLE